MKEKCGFTLVEVILSVALLGIITTGFMLIIGGNVQILSKGYLIEQSGYELGRMIENQGGISTGISQFMTFEDDEHEISGMITFDEYKVSRNGNVMYYFKADDKGENGFEVQ